MSSSAEDKAPTEELHLIPWENAENRREGPAVLLALKSVAFFGAIGFSGVVGFFVLMAWMPLLLLPCPRLYRRLGDMIGLWWVHIPAFLCNFVYRINLVVSGDALDPADHAAVFISNHATNFDWLFLWDFFLRQNRLLYEKIVLKGTLKVVPYFGWAMQVMKFLFLARNKDTDLPYLRAMMDSWCAARTPVQILLFPEGTINDEPGLLSSRNYALKAALPFRRHSLYPRDGALSLILSSLRGRGLSSLYDLTLGYPDVVPRAGFFAGHSPREVHLHVKRYSVEELPVEAERQAEWLQELWGEKDRLLTRFYEQRQRFHDGSPILHSVPVTKRWRHQVQMITAVLFFFFLVTLLTYLFITFSLTAFVVFLVVSHTIPVVVTYFGGFDQMELAYTGFLGKYP